MVCTECILLSSHRKVEKLSKSNHRKSTTTCIFTQFLQRPPEAGAVILLLRIRKLRHRAELVSAGADLSPGSLASRYVLYHRALPLLDGKYCLTAHITNTCITSPFTKCFCIIILFHPHKSLRCDICTDEDTEAWENSVFGLLRPCLF